MRKPAVKRPAPKRQVRQPRQARRAPIDFSRVKHNFDTVITHVFRGQSHEFNLLLGLTIALLGIGLVMVLDASYVTDVAVGNGPFATVLRQALTAVLGFLALTFFSLMSTSTLAKITPMVYLVTLAVQLGTALFGVSIGGNRNWISLGKLGTLQPSEFLKITMVLAVAMVLANRSRQYFDFLNLYGFTLLVAFAAFLFVSIGKDMGTVMVMAAIVLIQMFLAGLEKRHLYILMALGGVAALIATKMSANRWARTLAWANPYAPDPSDVNWQSKHGIWALAAGGFGGVGFGKSTMKWSWIPEVDNDYIFAIIGEEFGFIGAAVVIILFVWLAVILIRIMNKCSDLYSKLVVGGVMGWLVFQALVNIAVVLSMLPVLGVPLPMISSGGSSLLANLAAIGIVLGIERQNSSGTSPVRRRR